MKDSDTVRKHLEYQHWYLREVRDWRGSEKILLGPTFIGILYFFAEERQEGID